MWVLLPTGMRPPAPPWLRHDAATPGVGEEEDDQTGSPLPYTTRLASTDPPNNDTSDLGESLRDIEQIRQKIDTLQKDSGERTFRSQAQEANFRIVTPIYKIGEKPGTEISTGASGGKTTHLNGDYKADYKAEKSQAEYRMQIIDPKVSSHAHIPAHATNYPNIGKKMADDFPSQHGKRSLLKLDPLEQKRLKSVESRPITTSNYLTESVERHRKIQESDLEKYLKAREKDVNRPWEKPGWPGPKSPEDDRHLLELEQIRKQIDNLQKTVISRSQSLADLKIPPPPEERPRKTDKHTAQDPGWLIKVRTHRYMANVQSSERGPSRARSTGDLTQRKISFSSDWKPLSKNNNRSTSRIPDLDTFAGIEGHPSRGGDELAWQLKKDFHLSKYTSDQFDDDGSTSNVKQLRQAYLDRIRQDEQRHRQNRSPLTMLSSKTNQYSGYRSGASDGTSVGQMTPSLPDIAEAPHEGSSESVATLTNDNFSAISTHTMIHTSNFEDRRRSSVLSERQPSPSRDYDSGFSSSAASNVPLTQQKRSASQLLYPPGSTDQIANEHIPARRPTEKAVYENKPVPPAVVALNITKTPPKDTSAKSPNHDYPERLMSPPPGRQTPKSILKQQYIYNSQYSDRDQQWETSQHISRKDASMHDTPPPLPKSEPPAPGRMSADIRMRPQSTTTELDDADRFYQMQENLRKMRERSKTPQNVPRYPVTSFNGPFFKLEEVTTPSPDNRPRSQSVAPLLSVRESSRENVENYPDDYYRHEVRYNREHEEYRRDDGFNDPSRIKNMSASEVELNAHRRNYADPNDQNGVVIWPPLDAKSKERPRPASAMAKSLLDPDKISEFHRQKQMEYEAMRQREEKEMQLREKQMRAIQLQQQKLYEQKQQMMREHQTSMMESPYSVDDRYMPPPTPPPQHPTYHQPPPQQQPMYHDELLQPPHTRVFETRPISAMSGESFMDPRQSAISPSLSNTWKRTYVLDQPKIEAKNEILTSDELLERERVEVDLLKRREAFIEKPEQPLPIFRTGKRWQPPPEKPYVWPTLRRPMSVEPGLQQSHPVTFSSPGAQDEGEYKWEPVVGDPGFKKERKNFTPTHSPPHSPRRGYGTGPLDDVAKRQTKNVIQPSPDGSHRPKPAFKGPRHTPSGGFLPHAPNAVKVVKKRSSQLHDSTSPHALDQEAQDVEIIHERNYHRPGEPSRQRNASGHRESRSTPQQVRSRSVTGAREPINDWEKIYDLPPHSSQVTNKDPPSNIDVKRRLQLFEKQAATLQYPKHRTAERRVSESQQKTHLTSQYSIALSKGDSLDEKERHAPQPPARSSVSAVQRNTMPNGGTLLRRVHSREHPQQKPVPRERASTHSVPVHHPSSRHGRQSVTHSSSGHSVGHAPMIPLAPPPPLQMSNYSQPHHGHGQYQNPQQQHRQPEHQSSRRGLNRILQATAVSPVPPSYERARPYVPPPLPPGYRRGHSPPGQGSPRTPSVQQPGNTRRLVRLVQNQAQGQPVDGRGHSEAHRQHPHPERSSQSYHRATPINVGPGYSHRSTQATPASHSSAHHDSRTTRYHTLDRGERYL